VPDGSACFLSSQCQGRWCRKDPLQECGICKTRSSTPIQLDYPCAAPSCELSQVCSQGACVAPPALDEGGSCGNDTISCRFPLVCVGGGLGVHGTCGRRLPEGAGCGVGAGGSDDCDELKGISCDLTSKICKPFTPRPKPGEACPSGVCNGSAFCNTQQICEPIARPGESCGSTANSCLEPGVCGGVKLADGGVKLECGVPDPSQCQ
jgi:hypothetical protein